MLPHEPLLVWSKRYNIDLNVFGVNKPFALDRGELVLKKLEQEPNVDIAFVEPTPATFEQLRYVHTADYLKTLEMPATWEQIFELKPEEYAPQKAERPLTDLYEDIRLKVGGTIQAVEIAAKHGLAANLGGGYHHAFPDRGRGFCSLHDIGIAIRSAQKKSLCKKVMVVDLDFHQGDGTAVVFANDKDVFTLSVHSEEGWPEKKQKSSMDVSIFSEEQHLYKDKTQSALSQALCMFEPDLVVYVAGSDPYELDVLPGSSFIKLPLAVMKERDELVINTFKDRDIPLAMVFAGGYGPHVWEVHYLAVRHLLLRAGRVAATTTAATT